MMIRPVLVLAFAGVCSFAFAEGCPSDLAAGPCGPAPERGETTQVRYTNDFDVDFLFLTLARGERLNEAGTRYEFEAMSMPLLRGTWRGRDGDDEGKPEETKVFSDVPLFRVASVKTEGGDVADGRVLELPFVHAARFSTVPDDLKLSAGKLGILTLFDRRESGSEGLRWEALRNPLLRIVSGKEGEDARRFSLLSQRAEPREGSSGYALLDTYADGDFSTTRFLTLPFVDAMRADADKTAWNLSLVDSKLFSLFRTEVEPDGPQETVFVRLPMWSHLLKTTSDGGEGTSVSFLRLPVLGSVFGTRSDEKDQSLKVLFVPVY